MIRSTVAALVAGVMLAVGASPLAVADDHSLEASPDDQAIVLAWDGRSRLAAERSLFGDRVLSPGDRISRTVIVTNTGSETGRLSVSLTAGAQAPGTAALARAVRLYWSVGADGTGEASLKDLIESGGLLVDGLHLAPGQRLSIALTLLLPRETTTANRAHDGYERHDLGLYLRLVGDRDPVAPDAGASSNHDPRLQRTGLEALADPWVLLCLAGVGLILVLLPARRRRRDDDEARP